jgi:murein DD-endopeptidase MepM/ murein hydrolase activator NlpD
MTVLDPPRPFLQVAASPAPARPKASAAAAAPEPLPRAEPFGTLPPLSFVDTRIPVAWHNLPVRSLLSILVAAVAGSGLILTALTASIKDRLRGAESPIVAVQGNAPAREHDGRGDSLRPRSLAPEQERRSFSAPFSQIVGGQEVIRTARLERLSVRLATIADAAEPVPPTLLDDALRPGGVAPAGEETTAAVPAGEDADVIVTRRPLDPETVTDDPTPSSGEPPNDESAGESGELTAEVAAQEVRAFESGEVMRFAWLARRSVGLGGGVADEGLGPAEDDAFSHLSIRFIPENVTVIDRRQRQAPVVTQVVLDGSRPPAELLAERGLARDEADAVAALLAARGVQQGRTLALEAVPVAPGSAVHRIQRVAADVAGEMLPFVVRNDAGLFVGVDMSAASSAHSADTGAEDETQADGVPLYLTLFRTAREAGLSHEASLELVRLFASDYDLEQATGPRDRLDILEMEAEREAGERPLSSVLTLQLAAGGKVRRLYRSPESRPGDLAFVDGEGRSFHAALDTKPVLHARLTSRFGGRFHPILHYTRPHNGIDWAARIGTPVLAAGDGEVVEAGTHSGYGRHVEIRHADGFVTTYSHLDRIGRDIVVGKTVSRGDVIGTLGQSGLATGPHLHFEYKLNGIFVDPLTVKVPRARLAARDLGPRFEAWTKQLDRLATCEACDASH